MIPFIHKEVDFKLVEKLLQKSIKANHFTNEGPVKLQLEGYLKEYLKLDANKTVICTSSGTAALHAIMMFWGNGKTWTIPDFTFPSPATNRFSTDICDISPKTYTLSRFEYNAGRTIITNLFGTICDLEAEKTYLVIYDNAASPLSIYKNKTICNYGAFSFGSLHHTKYLGFGEGGFIVVPEYLDRFFRRICNFGYDKDNQYSRHSSNFKMSDISAAFILAHIMNFDIARYIKIQNRYIELLRGISGAQVFNYSEGVVYNSMPILFENPILVDPFRKEGIEVNKYYRPLKGFPNSTHLYERILSFPLHTGLTDKDLIYITNTIRNEANR